MNLRRAAMIVTVAVFAAACAAAEPAPGDRFVFTQLDYGPGWDPYPETWQDILQFVLTTTSIRVHPARRIVTFRDPLLFESPFVAVLGTGSFPPLNESETGALRRYLANGGLLFVEDSSGIRGSPFDLSFRREIAKVFPETRLKKLSADHPLYRSYYLLRKVGGRRLTNPYLEGIESGGRTAVIYSQNDIVGSWVRDRLGNYLWECLPGGQEQRFEAQKLTLNLVMYSVTGTYKSDAIHQPYLRQKLGE